MMMASWVFAFDFSAILVLQDFLMINEALGRQMLFVEQDVDVRGFLISRLK